MVSRYFDKFDEIFKTYIANGTRNDIWKEYWSTNPALAVPIFPQTMNCDRFEQI